MTSTITVADSGMFQIGQHLLIQGLSPSPPKWTKRRWVQDGDVMLGEWLYRIIGWEWLKSRPQRMIVTGIRDQTTAILGDT